MYDTTQLVTRLADIYLELLQNGVDTDFESFEDAAIRLGNDLISSAMSEALSRWDMELCAFLPKGCKIHDVRKRELVTEVGNVSFERRVCRDQYGCSYVPLDDELDICYGARISPGAFSFLVEAGAEVSYAKAARLLTRKSKASVSATTVMRALRQTGDLLEQESVARAHELYVLGVVPESKYQVEEICLEADGTWVSIQGQDSKAEIKALVAYENKEYGDKKKKRIKPVRFGCIASPKDFWTQGMSLVGKTFDLTKMSTCHFGTDGGGWCKSGTSYFPNKTNVVGHLDPFHVNRAVYRCFADVNDARQVLECIWRGEVSEGAKLLEEYIEEGVAREKISLTVCAYLRNNASIISVPGPSLGTMEAENQHVYKSRMASVPCAWSIEGASDMARIRSSLFSKQEIPRRRRSNSLSESRVAHRKEKILKSLTTKDYMPVHYEGEGYEPRQGHIAYAGTQVRFRSGLYSNRRIN